MNTVPPTLDDCLSAAEAHAERFFGAGPVPRWRPPVHALRWFTGATLATVAAGAIALAWAWNRPPARGGAEAVVVAAGPSRASPAPGAEPAASEGSFVAQPGSAVGCSGLACPTGPAPSLPAGSGPSGADAAAWPSDPDAWALDPQTIATPFPRAPTVERPHHNTPVVPDEADPTPADESQSDDADVGVGPID